jgi:hypothetical protein
VFVPSMSDATASSDCCFLPSQQEYHELAPRLSTRFQSKYLNRSGNGRALATESLRSDARCEMSIAGAGRATAPVDFDGWERQGMNRPS